MLDSFSWDDLWTMIKLASIPAVLKLYILAQSLHAYGIYVLFKNKDNIFKHSVFVMLDKVYTDQELFNKIPDLARREIFKDIYKIEIYSMNEILLGFRDVIYIYDSFFRFMAYHRDMENSGIIDLFLRFFDAHRDKLEKKMLMRLTANGLDKVTAKYIIQKYYEFSDEKSYAFRKHLEVLKRRKNLYHSVLDILDRIEIDIQSSKKYLPIEYSRLNGNLNNITYKTYVSKTETKHEFKK